MLQFYGHPYLNYFDLDLNNQKLSNYLCLVTHQSTNYYTYVIN